MGSHYIFLGQLRYVLGALTSGVVIMALDFHMAYYGLSLWPGSCFLTFPFFG